MRKLGKLLLILVVLCAVALGIAAVRNGGDVAGTLKNLSGSISQTLGARKRASADGLPEVDLNSWALKLVNRDHPLSENFTVDTGVSEDGYLFDSRAVSALDAMLDAGRAEGLQLTLTSAYRTRDYQAMLFENKVSEVMQSTGLGREEAEDEAATVVARPGTSEHELGLAADIVCEYYGILDDGYADTPEAKWLEAHCAQYGFILRYAGEKEDITGVIYEPWHFRYVGEPAAEYIMGHGLCLEEFVEKLEARGA